MTRDAENQAQNPGAQATNARFTVGSTMRHVVVMTATGTVGLMAVFLVDFANLFYISQLGQQELAAAIGYAGTILFFNISICIGITIAATALVSRYIGQGDRAKARHMAGSALAFIVNLGLASIVLIKASKYTLFDPSKERAYVPLDEESKVRGKAAVDGFGSRVGKSLGSGIISMVLVPWFGSIADSIHVIFVIALLALAVWLTSVGTLSKLFKELTDEH